MGIILYGTGEKEKGNSLAKQAIKVYEEINSPMLEKARETLNVWTG
jgi:hypothetical protein